MADQTTTNTQQSAFNDEAKARLLAEVLESIPDEIFVLDRESRIVYVNQPASTRYDRAAPDNARFDSVTLPQEIKDFVSEFQRRDSDKKDRISREIYIPTPTGLRKHECSIAEAQPGPTGNKSIVLSLHDIHEKAREFDTLRLDHLRINAIADSLPVLISFVDVTCRYRFNNRTYEDWFGRSPSDLDGKTMEEVLGESAWSIYKNDVFTALSGKTVSFEWTVSYPHIGERTVTGSFVPQWDSDYKIIGIASIIRDISAYKRTQLALTASESRYRSLAETIPQLVSITDSAGKPTYLNDRWGEYLGDRLADLLQGNWDPIIYEADRSTAYDSWLGAVSGGKSYEMQFRMRRHDGVYRWFLSRGVAIQSAAGGETQWMGACTDIDDQKRELTERQEREEEITRLNLALNERVTELETIFQVLPIPAVLMNDLDKITFNPECSELLGKGRMTKTISVDCPVEAGEPAMRYFSGGHEIGFNDLPMMVTVAGGQAVRDFDFEIVRPDGVSVSLLGHTAPLYDSEGAIRGCVGAFMDLTERKRQQQLLTEYYEREVLINRVGQAIRTTLDPDVAEHRALQVVGEAMKLDRCILSLIDVSANRIVTGHDWCREGLNPIAGVYRLSDFSPDIKSLRNMERTMVIDDIWSGALRHESALALESVGLRSFISVPVHEGGSVVALLCAGMTDSPRSWTPEEIVLAETVASQIRTAVESVRSNLREHRIATALQQSLQPSVLDQVGNLKLAAYYKPALNEAAIGGDFFDVFSVGHGRHAIVVGDVSGKGLAAACQVSVVRNMLRLGLQVSADVASAITQINEVLMAQDLVQGFLTLFVGIYDDTTSDLSYVTCGQEPPILRQASNGEVAELNCDSPPLGIDKSCRFHQHSIHLNRGDLLLIYTDGLTESGPSRLKLLGKEGVVSLLGSYSGSPVPGEILDFVVSQARKNALGTFWDDACVLAISVS